MIGREIEPYSYKKRFFWFHIFLKLSNNKTHQWRCSKASLTYGFSHPACRRSLQTLAQSLSGSRHFKHMALAFEEKKLRSGHRQPFNIFEAFVEALFVKLGYLKVQSHTRMLTYATTKWNAEASCCQCRVVSVAHEKMTFMMLNINLFLLFYKLFYTLTLNVLVNEIQIVNEKKD